MKYCQHCGAEIQYDDAVVCTKCGRSLSNRSSHAEKGQNGLGIAGFVMSLLGVVFSWTASGAFVLLTLGFVFSIIGICQGKSKGQKISLAVAGLILSLLDLIVAIIIIITVGSIIGSIISTFGAVALAI